MSTNAPALPNAFLRAPLAHRAYWNLAQARPENSRAAIRAAVEAGYGIEIDVQLSRDGAAMVFHDYALDRLTAGKGAVNAQTAAALETIPLKAGDGSGMPQLSDVLDIVAGRAALLIEIKDQDGGLGANIGRLEQAVATALTGYRGPVAVMSFNPHSVIQMAALAPDVPRGITTCDYASEDWPMLNAAKRARLRAIPDYDAAGASFISHQAEDLSRARVADLKTRGAGVLCWTIRSRAQETRARRIAQNITFEGYAAEIPA